MHHHLVHGMLRRLLTSARIGGDPRPPSRMRVDGIPSTGLFLSLAVAARHRTITNAACTPSPRRITIRPSPRAVERPSPRL